MAEIKMRYNATAQEVELLVDNEVAFSSGKDVFESWVKAYNDANPPKVVEPAAPVEEKVVEPGNEVNPETEGGEASVEVDNTTDPSEEGVGLVQESQDEVKA